MGYTNWWLPKLGRVVNVQQPTPSLKTCLPATCLSNNPVDNRAKNMAQNWLILRDEKQRIQVTSASTVT
eukprot:6456905-Amphidinium_carterae.1